MGARALLECIEKLAEKIESEELKRVVLSIVKNPVLTITDIKPLIKLEESPAAPRKHHFFTGGLLIHTCTVAKIAISLADIVEEVYGIKVDRDLVIATSILHDIYKYYQYAPDSLNGGYKAREDWYLSHDYAIVAELSKRNAPEKLIRAVTEVHGQVPFSTIEGLLVHLADSVDARLGEVLQNILLSRVRDYEKLCALYKALDHLISARGVKGILGLALEDVAGFRKVFEDACKEITAYS